jgi:hypothetical protein
LSDDPKPEAEPALTLMEQRGRRHKTVALTIGAIIGIILCFGVVAMVTLTVNKNYNDGIAARVAVKVAEQESQIVVDEKEDIIRIQTGATIMTTVWYSKDMKEPIVRHALVAEAVCKSSSIANQQAMAQIKKAASAIFITCQNIQELDR